jgi:hypothetical protein
MKNRRFIFGIVLCSFAFAQQDNTPPQLVGIKVTPSVVDVSSQAVRCTIELALKDDISGVAPAGANTSYWAITLRSPSGRQARVIFNKQLKLTYGTITDGVWSAEFTMPQFSEAGIWKVTQLTIPDGAGNSLSLDPFKDIAQDLEKSAFNVVSQRADVSPPQLNNVRFDPPSIDLSGSLHQVRVIIAAKDDLSGVSFTPDIPTTGPTEPIGIVLTSPSQRQSLNAMGFAKWSLISGTPNDGVWQATLDGARMRETGNWKITRVCLKDAVRNIRCYGSEVSSLGAPDLIVTQSAAK